MKKSLLLLALLPALPAMAQKFMTPIGASPPPAPAAMAPLGGSPSIPPGLHIGVVDGAIKVNNSGGVKNYEAGQFGYVASSQQPPVIVPNNPAMPFTPPPVFNQGAAMPGSTSAATSNIVDCEVR